MSADPLSDTQTTNKANSSLDLYSKVVDPTTDDDLLDSVNLGTGNYANREMWQQIQSFRDGLFADAAFSRLLLTRGVYETKLELSRHGWQYWDEDGNKKELTGKLDEEFDDPEERSEYRRDRGKEIWEQLPVRERKEALLKFSGISDDWTPPFWRMLKARHETSRSRGARLLDNVFGRVQEVIGGDDEAVMDRE